MVSEIAFIRFLVRISKPLIGSYAIRFSSNRRASLLCALNKPIFHIDRRLATEDGDEHPDLALVREYFVDRSFVALESTFFDGDIVALVQIHFQLRRFLRRLLIEQHLFDFDN